MSDNYTVQTGIESKIALLEECRAQLQVRADEKARALSEYDKALAITMLKMKNGKQMELGGELIDKPINTLIEKLAKGVVWQEKLNAEKADGMYKALITAIDCIQSELNGLQSINKTSANMMN
jgi:hypothetical protein